MPEEPAENPTPTLTPAPVPVVGINHIALEVGDLDEALAFYGKLFKFEQRSRSETQAEIDLGDQFIALVLGRMQPADVKRHVGFVVADKEAVRAALLANGVEILPLPDRFLDFLDPWGNRIEIIGYENIQFTKADHVLRGMGLDYLRKTDAAIDELTEKGMRPG
ncbi:VOC family protein [Nisaea denitrificans]|uniref:VOC family protein n=1 Tax=Nisaea denitrificans TaxID=390877 RepID=UPI0003FD8399|nr:VOC family protein [Nisaea denitrificans]